MLRGAVKLTAGPHRTHAQLAWLESALNADRGIVAHIHRTVRALLTRTSRQKNHKTDDQPEYFHRNDTSSTSKTNVPSGRP